MSHAVTYTAVLPVRAATVDWLTGLLAAERAARGTRHDRRALSCREQAILALCWFYDATRIRQLVRDHRIGTSTCYRYLHEAIDVLAAAAPGLDEALTAARAAGHTHLGLDGTVIFTDRVRRPGPNPGVHLWWSGKHHRHGANIQVLTTPDGWPLHTSRVRPGREKDVTCARRQHLPDLLAQRWNDPTHVVLADLGYEGEAAIFVVPDKNHRGRGLSVDQRTRNLLHRATPALCERGNSLLKTTFAALRQVSLCPWRIGDITAAALALLHHEHDRAA
ncbi:IS5-like element IS470 family transposase [Pseudonocardia yuanmonensis]|uniref:IS5-like element IS470 family transposase n=1 Tax=Pseudonocardia yuanmonensis TaxID=1095914 RepID=A0ABP8WAY8_9PSEU